MSKKTYHLSGEHFEMTVEIDHDVMTEERLTEINTFWTDADYRLSQADDSVLHAVLGMLFHHVQRMLVECPYNVKGVIHEFAWNHPNGRGKNGQEGWPDMDGSYGIRIVSVSDVDLSEQPTITEEKAHA